MIEVPFFWTRGGLNKYLQQYFNDVVKALEARGVKMKRMQNDYPYFRAASKNYRHGFISVEYLPNNDGDRLGIFQVRFFQNNACFLEIYDLVDQSVGESIGYTGNVDYIFTIWRARDLLRKSSKLIALPQKIADTLCRQADLYDRTVQAIKSDSVLGALYEKVHDSKTAKDMPRLLKLLEKKGIKISR